MGRDQRLAQMGREVAGWNGPLTVVVVTVVAIVSSLIGLGIRSLLG